MLQTGTVFVSIFTLSVKLVIGIPSCRFKLAAVKVYEAKNIIRHYKVTSYEQ